MSAGLKQASVIFLPPLIARIFSAPSPSSSAETAQGSQPSAIRATRRREGSVIPPTQIGGPPRRAGFGSNSISRKLVYQLSRDAVRTEARSPGWAADLGRRDDRSFSTAGRPDGGR